MGAGRGGVPGLRDDDVVEGGVAFAEAGQADFDDHFRGALRWGMGRGRGDGMGMGAGVEIDRAGLREGLADALVEDVD